MDWKERLFLSSPVSRRGNVIHLAVVTTILVLFSCLFSITDAAGTKTKTLTKTISRSVTLTKTLTKTLSTSHTTSISSSSTSSGSMSMSRTRTFTATHQSLTRTFTSTLQSLTRTFTRSSSRSDETESSSKSASFSSTRSPLSPSHSASVSDSRTLSEDSKTASDSYHATSESPEPTLSENTATESDNSMTLSETYNLSLSSSETWTPSVTGETPPLTESQSESVTDVTASASNSSLETISSSLSIDTVSGTVSPNETVTISESETHSQSHTISQRTESSSNSSELTESMTHQLYPPYNSPLETASVAIAGASVSVGLLSTIVGGASPLTVLAAQRLQMLATFRKCRFPDSDYSLSILESPTQLSLPLGVEENDFVDSEQVEIQKHAAANYAGAAVGNSLIILALWMFFWLIAKYKTVSQDRNLAEALKKILAPSFMTVCALVLWQPTVEGSIGAAAFAYENYIPHIALGAVIFLATLSIWIGLFYKTMWHAHFRPQFQWKRIQEDSARGGLLKKGDWDPYYWHCVQRPMPPPHRMGPQNPFKVLVEQLIFRNGEWRVEDKVLRGVHKPEYIANLPSVDRGSKPLSAVMKSVQEQEFRDQQQHDAGTVAINMNDNNSEDHSSSSQLTRHDYFWWRNAHDAFFFFVTDRARWFFIVEWAVSMLWGVLNVLARRRSCTLGATLLFLPMLVYIVLLLWKRPFCVVFDNLTMGAIAILLTACIAVTALAINAEGEDAFPVFNPDAPLVKVAEILLLVVCVVILLRAISDVFRIIRTLIRDKEHQKENEIRKKEEEERKRQRELEERLLAEEEEQERQEEERKRLEEERIRNSTLVEMDEVEQVDEELQKKEDEENQRLLEEAEMAAEEILTGRRKRRRKKNKKKNNTSTQKKNRLLDDEDERELSDSSNSDQYEYVDEEEEDEEEKKRKLQQQILEDGQPYSYDYDGTLRASATTSMMSPREELDMVEASSSPSPSKSKLQRGNKDDEKEIDEEEFTTLPEKIKKMYELDRTRAKQLAEKKKLEEYEYEMNFDADGHYVGPSMTMNDDDSNSKPSAAAEGAEGSSSSSPKLGLAQIAKLKQRIPKRRPPRPMDPKEIHRVPNALLYNPKQTRKVRPKKLDDVVRPTSYLWFDDDEVPEVKMDDDSSSSSSSSSPPSRKSTPKKQEPKPTEEVHNHPNSAVTDGANDNQEKTDQKKKQAPSATTTAGKKKPPSKKPPAAKRKSSPPKELSPEDRAQLEPPVEIKQQKNNNNNIKRTPPPTTSANKSPPRVPQSIKKEIIEENDYDMMNRNNNNNDDELLFEEGEEHNSPGTAPATPKDKRKNSPVARTKHSSGNNKNNENNTNNQQVQDEDEDDVAVLVGEDNGDERINAKQRDLAEGVIEEDELAAL